MVPVLEVTLGPMGSLLYGGKNQKSKNRLGSVQLDQTVMGNMKDLVMVFLIPIYVPY
jgi:hypothetical protein